MNFFFNLFSRKPLDLAIVSRINALETHVVKQHAENSALYSKMTALQTEVARLNARLAVAETDAKENKVNNLKLHIRMNNAKRHERTNSAQFLTSIRAVVNEVIAAATRPGGFLSKDFGITTSINIEPGSDFSPKELAEALSEKRRSNREVKKLPAPVRSSGSGEELAYLTSADYYAKHLPWWAAKHFPSREKLLKRVFAYAKEHGVHPRPVKTAARTMARSYPRTMIDKAVHATVVNEGGIAPFASVSN